MTRPYMFQSLIGIQDDFNRRIPKPLQYLVFEVQFREPDLRIAFQLPGQTRGQAKKGLKLKASKHCRNCGNL